jgi:hypothetical protein
MRKEHRGLTRSGIMIHLSLLAVLLECCCFDSGGSVGLAVDTECDVSCARLTPSGHPPCVDLLLYLRAKLREHYEAFESR